MLRYRIDREDGEHVASEVPEEVNGRPVLKPSVRVVFDDFEDAQRFIGVAEAVRSGAASAADVGLMVAALRRSFHVRLTTVAQKP